MYHINTYKNKARVPFDKYMKISQKVSWSRFYWFSLNKGNPREQKKWYPLYICKLHFCFDYYYYINKIIKNKKKFMFLFFHFSFFSIIFFERIVKWIFLWNRILYVWNKMDRSRFMARISLKGFRVKELKGKQVGL